MHLFRSLKQDAQCSFFFSAFPASKMHRLADYKPSYNKKKHKHTSFFFKKNTHTKSNTASTANHTSVHAGTWLHTCQCSMPGTNMPCETVPSTANQHGHWLTWYVRAWHGTLACSHVPACTLVCLGMSVCMPGTDMPAWTLTCHVSGYRPICK
jgi:hypothetical protein